MSLEFVKLHGTGNDFLFMTAESVALEGDIGSLAVRLCDRHFGVGADGLLIFSRQPDGQARMTIINSDGSRAEMCGNGIRCFARELVERYGFSNDLTISTDAGPKRCQVRFEGQETWVKVAMGPVLTEDGASLLPLGLRPEHIEAHGRLLPVHVASTGNPHAVIFGRFSRPEMERLGPGLTTHSRFPRQTNVEFANVRSRTEIELTVHERGAGFTQACGTGSLATVGVAVAVGLCDASVPVKVTLPGGTLRICVEADLSASEMEGPAVRVFDGRLYNPLR